MGQRFDRWTIQTPNTHKDSNETQLCHLQHKITQDYKHATKSPRICSNLDQQKLDVTFAIMEVNALIQQHLATFALAWVSSHMHVRYMSCTNNLRIKPPSNWIVVHTVGLCFTAQACRTPSAHVHRGVLRATKNKVLRKREAEQTLERLRATSNLWSGLCEKLKHTADIWAEALQSWPQPKLHLRSLKCINWLNTHIFTFLPLRGQSKCYPASLTIANQLITLS